MLSSIQKVYGSGVVMACAEGFVTSHDSNLLTEAILLLPKIGQNP